MESAGLDAAAHAREPAESAAARDRARARAVRMNDALSCHRRRAGRPFGRRGACAERRARRALSKAAPQAGGRCRSYFDPELGQMIDNGNHLVLSGNHATMTICARIGALGHLAGPDTARFDFVDVQTGERWTIAPNEGPLPWWVLDAIAPRAGHARSRLSRAARNCCARCDGETHRRRDRLRRRAVGAADASRSCSPR